MSVELHLPDLPEVPLSLGPPRGAGPRPRLPWHLRLREALSSYLPLLLMALLALATLWLVKNSPRPLAPAEDRPLSSEPDYTMTQFSMERFEPGGRLRLRIEGEQLRHFPATDRIEIDVARIRAIGADGGVTLAQARQAVANGDGSEVQLLGGAEVRSVDASGMPLVVRSEFLHLFTVLEQARTHLPVFVQRGDSELRAAGMAYDHVAARLDLTGPLRTELPPRAAAAPVAAAAAAAPAPAAPAIRP